MAISSTVAIASSIASIVSAATAAFTVFWQHAERRPRLMVAVEFTGTFRELVNRAQAVSGENRIFLPVKVHNVGQHLAIVQETRIRFTHLLPGEAIKLGTLAPLNADAPEYIEAGQYEELGCMYQYPVDVKRPLLNLYHGERGRIRLLICGRILYRDGMQSRLARILSTSRETSFAFVFEPGPSAELPARFVRVGDEASNKTT